MFGKTHFDAANKLWCGPKVEANVDKHKNVGEILLESLGNADPEEVMQIDGDTGESLTKAEVRIRTIRCAQNLTKLGCTQNDRIGIVARNHHNLTPLMYGALCIGSPVSPLDVVIVKDGIAHILERVRQSFIFCDSDVLESVNQIKTDIGLNAKIFSVNEQVEGFDSIDSLMKETGNENAFVCTELDDAYSHIGIIACSSGSTGLPKSIPMSQAQLNFMFCQRKMDLGFVTLCYSSLYWFSGVWVLMNSAFKHKRVFTSQPFSEKSFIDLVDKYKVQMFAGPPCQMQAVLKSDLCETADLSSLALCILIGSVLPTVLVESVQKIIPKCVVITGYAMTEVTTGVTFTMPNEFMEHPGSVGSLVPGVQVKIISETTDERCGIGEQGELYVKSPIPSLGYYQDEVATKNAFDDENFYKTGDLGFFDESGRLRIIGRIKEIFKNHGFSIWPAELEDVILKHPAIQNACVVHVFDDEIFSDLPAAVVIRKQMDSITEKEVYALIADQLATYKRLDGGVYFVDEFPMTPSGKVIRSEVQKIAQRLYQEKRQKQNV